MPITVAVVPHTHWDREWHETLEQLRLRLVAVVDDVLDLLEHDPSYPHFLLDGQTAVVDDYLTERPEAEARIRRLVTGGRLEIGPWTVLPDEFLVSGETLVRNLQHGLTRAAALGSSGALGYLPDTFGHVAQMPQLLQLAGIEHAVVWRGVPSHVDRSAFWWESPDGSRVRAEHLYGSYANGVRLPADPTALLERVWRYRLELGARHVPGSAVLMMNGGDHQPPQRDLGSVLAAADAATSEVCFVVQSLAGYLASAPREGLPTWCGELRSGAFANLLMGVASNRVDVHRAAAAAERALERTAEPLAATFLPAEEYPARLLERAWELLVLNSAHDSAAACSRDEVVAAVLVRYREARDLAEAVVGSVMTRVAAASDAPIGAVVVANPAAVHRAGVVEVRIPGAGPAHVVGTDGTCSPAQVTPVPPHDDFVAVVHGDKVHWILGLIEGARFRGAPIARVESGVDPSGLAQIVLVTAGPDDPAIDLGAVRAELASIGPAGTAVSIRQRAAPDRTAVFRVELPASGASWWLVRDGAAPIERSVTATLDAGTGRLVNDLLTVTVDGRDGTLGIETRDGVRVSGAHRLVESGDAGDTYNYSPPDHDVVVDAPESVTLELLEPGPVRARVLVTARHRWPVGLLDPSRAEPGDVGAARHPTSIVTEVRTVVELRVGERFVRLATSFDHRVHDHRLRAHFPLPAPVRGSDAECAFAVVSRGLAAEGGPHEAGLPTFVSRRFVDCSDGELGLALIHDGLLEYEVLDGGRELALTLVRATGYLSRLRPSLRPNPAGPVLPLDGPQLPGPLRFEYALLPHRGSWSQAQLHEAADEVLVALPQVVRTTANRPGADRPGPRGGAALRVDGAPVDAVRRVGGRLEVRMHNPRSVATAVHVELAGRPATGEVVDLLGAARSPFSGSTRLDPGAILTIRLDETTARGSRPGVAGSTSAREQGLAPATHDGPRRIEAG